jgi:hypothetical protein
MPTVIEAPFFPIIYVRGFAMRQKDVAQTVATPFMGFNDGATKHRQRANGGVTRFAFESPVIRLMKDFGYRDVYVDGEQLVGRVSPRSIVIYRYYDDEDPHLGRRVSVLTAVRRTVVGDVLGDLEKMHAWALGLRALIYRVQQLVCGEDEEAIAAFRVHLVAHSMGGLICRYLLQNDDVKTRHVVDRIDKVFTYATPHNGVDLFGVNLASQYFQRPVMRQYLNIKGEAANSLEDKFPTSRFFCLVGTNARDYDEVYGLSRWAAGPMSDGLVAVQNAYVEGTPRAYVHRSHSGPFGIVNSEEGYQNLWRFLFGDVSLQGRLEVKALPPSGLDDSSVDRSYYIDCTVAPRGAFGYKLTRRWRDDWSAIRRTREEWSASPTRGAELFSVFVARPDPGHSDRAVFAVDLAISESVAEEQEVPLVQDYLPDQYLFRESLTLTIGSRETGLAYSWQSQTYDTLIGTLADRVYQAPDGAVDLETERYEIPLNADNGFQGSLFVTVRRGERDPFKEEAVSTGRSADGWGAAKENEE